MYIKFVSRFKAFESADEAQTETTQLKAAVDQYVSVALFMLYKVVLTFESLVKILK